MESVTVRAQDFKMTLENKFALLSREYHSNVDMVSGNLTMTIRNQQELWEK